MGEAPRLKVTEWARRCWLCGLAVGWCKLTSERNKEYHSTQRGLYLVGETHAVIKHNHQEVSGAVLGCVTTTAIPGGEGWDLCGNYGNWAKQGWSCLQCAWGCLPVLWTHSAFPSFYLLTYSFCSSLSQKYWQAYLVICVPLRYQGQGYIFSDR